jgi:hypothetical protein
MASFLVVDEDSTAVAARVSLGERDSHQVTMAAMHPARTLSKARRIDAARSPRALSRALVALRAREPAPAFPPPG